MTGLNITPVNTFTPVFLTWNLPSLNLEASVLQIGELVINQKLIGSVDPDETAHQEPSHLDLHFLQMYLFDLHDWNSYTIEV